MKDFTILKQFFNDFEFFGQSLLKRFQAKTEAGYPTKSSKPYQKKK